MSTTKQNVFSCKKVFKHLSQNMQGEFQSGIKYHTSRYCLVKHKYFQHLEVLMFISILCFLSDSTPSQHQLSICLLFCVQNNSCSEPYSIESNVQQLRTVAKLSAKQIHTFTYFLRKCVKMLKKHCTADSSSRMAIKPLLLFFFNASSFLLFHTSSSDC